MNGRAQAVRPRMLPLARLALLGAVMTCAVPVQAARPSGADAIALAALEKELAVSPGTAAVHIATEQFGELASATLGANGDPEWARALEQVGRRLLNEAHRRQDQAEAQAGGDENALARLYDSPAWNDLSYAYDWLPCWIGWMQLISLAPSGQTREAQIEEARQALQRGLLIVSRPELVARSGRGLARIALLQHRPEKGLEILKSLRAGFDERLQANTRADLDEQIGALAALAAPRQGGANASTGAPAAVSMSAQLERIHALLEQQQRLGVGGAEAAPLIQSLLQVGAWDERLVYEALQAHGALADQEVGVIGDLLVAEDLLDNGHFYSASEKYTQFFRQVADAPQRGLARWRYRHGYACLKAGLIDCALGVADDLQRRWSLNPDLEAANRKLRFFGWYERNRAVSNEESARQLAGAAGQIIRSNPLDPDADWARLALADVASDAGEGERLLAAVRDPKRLEGAVDALRYRWRIEELLDAVTGQDVEALKPMAQRAQVALESVGDAQRDEPWIKTTALFIRTLLWPTDSALRERLVAAVDAPESDRLAWQAGYWALLGTWVAKSERAELHAEAARTAASAYDEWRLALLLGTLEALDDASLTSASAALLASVDIPASGQARALISRGTAQLRLGQAQQAYETARRALVVGPDAPDARWLFAASCDASGHAQEADAAWRQLHGERGQAMSARETLWRLELAALARRPHEGCALARGLGREAASLSASHRSRARHAAELLGCLA